MMRHAHYRVPRRSRQDGRWGGTDEFQPSRPGDLHKVPGNGCSAARQNGKRGPAYIESWAPVLGITLVITCAVGITVVALDDVTGIGVADDFLFGPLGSGFGTGLIMIFG